MPVGWNGSQNQLQSAACGVAQQFAAAAAGAQALISFVNGVSASGGPGLAAYGFSSEDTTTFQALLAVLEQYAGVFYGQVTVATATNFFEELAQLIGPPDPAAVAAVATAALANSGLNA
jgi:hypothetical protein